MPEPTRMVFDIMRFSIRDGPGIRTTVFFKGCPLECWWCHNPESRAPGREIVFREERCVRCGSCVEACPTGAVSGDGVCDLCGTCVAACPSGAREILGREMTAPEILAEIVRDRVFYEQSGGGVTFSGGEPMVDPEFLQRLLTDCRREKVHTAVDTCGYAPPAVFRGLRDKVDLFLYDLKLMDDARHSEVTGVSNDVILGNLKELAAEHRCVTVRIPIIPGVNDDDRNILETGRFLSDLGLEEVQLLPYHATAKGKYDRMQKRYRLPETRAPSPGELAALCGTLAKFGLHARVGG